MTAGCVPDLVPMPPSLGGGSFGGLSYPFARSAQRSFEIRFFSSINSLENAIARIVCEWSERAEFALAFATAAKSFKIGSLCIAITFSKLPNRHSKSAIRSSKSSILKSSIEHVYEVMVA
jgi:hypothetical protein